MTALIVSSAIACGDDEPAPPQAVFWFGLSPTLGGTCSSSRIYQFPEDAQDTILSGTGVGDRVEDTGRDPSVVCSVSPSGGEDEYDVDIDFAIDEIGNFSARGRLAEGQGGEIDIAMNTTQFQLRQEGCTATVRRALAGAIWIDNLSCPSLADASSPGIACVGNGGLIFENCSR